MAATRGSERIRTGGNRVATVSVGVEKPTPAAIQRGANSDGAIRAANALLGGLQAEFGQNDAQSRRGRLFHQLSTVQRAAENASV
ncbi:MAG: hypothetical protein ACYS0E_12330 [Planctomycetota bacterium]|jgi:hypothetical protein